MIMNFKELKNKIEETRSKYFEELQLVKESRESAERKVSEITNKLENFNGTADEYFELSTRLSAYKEFLNIQKHKEEVLDNCSPDRDAVFTALKADYRNAVEQNLADNAANIEKLCEYVLKKLEPLIKEEHEVYEEMRKLANDINVSPASRIFASHKTIENECCDLLNNAKWILNRSK